MDGVCVGFPFADFVAVVSFPSPLFWGSCFSGVQRRLLFLLDTEQYGEERAGVYI